MGLVRIFDALLFGHAPERVAQASVAAINRRDWVALRRLLAADFYFRDYQDHRVEGPDVFLGAMQAMVAEVPDFAIDVERYERAGNAVVVRGAMKSVNPRVNATSVWRMDIAHGRIACLQNYRENDTLRLFDYARVNQPS